MPAKLATTIAKIGTVIPNNTNAAVVQEYSDYLKSRAVSESHHNNCLKAAIAFSRHLGPKMTFYDVERREQVLGFLDTKIKSPEIDPDKRWITTWNDQLRLKTCNPNVVGAGESGHKMHCPTVSTRRYGYARTYLN